MNKSEMMLFALLKSSLNGSAVVQDIFENASVQDWEYCSAKASKQGVLALAWEGIQTLPLELQPQKHQKFKWALSVDKYESKHRKYCDTVQELQQFYKEHGIVAVQMKGVGFSAGYNQPHHREGGDIDIFTFSADTAKMSHREANSLADNLMQEMGNHVEMHGYKHSNFYYKGIPVENHKYFLNVQINRKFLGWLDEFLHKVIGPEEVQLYNGEYKILVPSPMFNTLFISCHAFQHYGSGIALHHLYDWAVILKNYGLHLPCELENEKFLRAIAAMTHLCNKHLGTSIELGGYPDGYKEMADEMLKEMMYPIYSKVVPHTSYAKIFIYKTKKVLRSAKLANDVFGASVFGRIMESFIAHVMHPSTIFGRGDEK
ncbi:MAG: nucleotidyltransferase family protein [Lachnospiraceae bacterium]|nr:nucleotidyltransferase family protein [Lachnospiraceae bacterium]